MTTYRTPKKRPFVIHPKGSSQHPRFVQHVSIDHGRRYVIVPKEFLRSPYIVICLQEVSSKGMAKGTGACVVYAVTHITTFHHYSSKRHAVNYYLLRRRKTVAERLPPHPALSRRGRGYERGAPRCTFAGRRRKGSRCAKLRASTNASVALHRDTVLNAWLNFDG
jgi:hypothetical protein